MTTRLFARASNGKIKEARVSLCLSPGDIVRFTGYLGGQYIKHSNKISSPKQGRTEAEQGELEYNSILNKYRDRGYKTLSDLYNAGLAMPPMEFDESIATVEEWQKVLENLPVNNTDASGNIKPMLAKDYKKLKSLNFPYLAQRKLNGVRCLMFWDEEAQEVMAISRQGKDYRPATRFIREELKQLLQEHPIALDGELYIHNQSLQYISGLVRAQDEREAHQDIRYLVYDVATEDMNQRDRLDFLYTRLDIGNYKTISKVPSALLHNLDQVKEAHDFVVKHGYEGIILRDPEADYGFGKRDNRMLKYKEFMDEEFPILDIQLGERGTEDLVFICACTGTDRAFKVKPMGDRVTKQGYWDNFSDIKGKQLTVRFFEWSEDKVPIHGVGVAIRDYE